MKEHEQQVYEEKVRFLINISHELRTPLTLIHAPLKQLMDKLTADNENYPLIQSICKQSERMKNILNTCLLYTSTGEDCYLHDLKHIYKINSSLNELELIFTCQTDTVFNSVSLDENGFVCCGQMFSLLTQGLGTKIVDCLE